MTKPTTPLQSRAKIQERVGILKAAGLGQAQAEGRAEVSKFMSDDTFSNLTNYLVKSVLTPEPEIVEKASAPKSTDDTVETEKVGDPSVDITTQLLTDYYGQFKRPGFNAGNAKMKGY